MAASPPETLRVHLAEQRSCGAPFTVAWSRSLEVALSETDDPDWLAVITATRETWRAAYERAPAARPERALHLIGTDPDRSVPLIGGDRICGHCGEAIAVGKRSSAVYCSRECQRSANGRMAA